MFEKEANKWVENNLHSTEEDYIKAFKDGAEFGYNKCNEQLTKAKELLTKWVELFKPRGGNIPPTSIQVETEQFLREVTE